MEKIFDLFKPPFWYDDFGQKIFDKDNNLILEIRGAGKLQYYANGNQMQDEFGKLVTNLLNKHCSVEE